MRWTKNIEAKDKVLGSEQENSERVAKTFTK